MIRFVSHPISVINKNINSRKCRSKILRKVNIKSYSTQIGLFGVKDLYSPDDWNKLLNECTEQCNQIVKDLNHYQSYHPKEVII